MSVGGERGDDRGVFGKLWERFGGVAKRLGLVYEEDLDEALDHQDVRKTGRATHRKIGEILVESKKMSEEHVQKVLAEQKKAEPLVEKARAAPKAGKKAKKKAKAKKASPRKKSAKKAKKKAK